MDSPFRRATVVVVGKIRGFKQPGAPCSSDGRAVDVVACPSDVKALQQAIKRTMPGWLLLAVGVGEVEGTALVRATRTIDQSVRLAMLGPPSDAGRCERWVRRGCLVYLTTSTPLASVIKTLLFAARHRAVVIDQQF